MATMTAQILLGGSNAYHGGIFPTHALYLSENSRPAWVLMRVDIYPEGPIDIRRVIWIPTVERMLEDAIAMIALHVVRDPGVVAVAARLFEEPEADRIELYDDANGPLDELYEAVRGIQGFPKLVISPFAGSTIARQLEVLREYSMDVEVCTPTYRREWSQWQNKTIEDGSLELGV